jgi:recombination associated protein RdgC
MYFKNLQIYRILPDWRITADDLEQQLARRPFTPPGAQDFESRGWVSPADDGALVRMGGDNWMVCLQSDEKILPTAVVKQIADERADELAEQQGYKLGRKAMKELREQITSELLPRAFARRRKTYAWLNIPAGWLVVDAPSQNKAEDVLEQLRHTLDQFPVGLLRTEHSPMSAMAGWLSANEAPDGFTLEQDFMLESIAEDGAKATFARCDPDAAHIAEHLEAGRLPTRLALTFDDRVSFVLTQRMELKRVEFLDVVRESITDEDREDAQALFDAEFALMAGELLRLLDATVEALGGELVREPDLVDRAKEAA